MTPSRRRWTPIIKNGEYEKILAKWGVEAGAVKEATVNGGT